MFGWLQENLCGFPAADLECEGSINFSAFLLRTALEHGRCGIFLCSQDFLDLFFSVSIVR